MRRATRFKQENFPKNTQAMKGNETKEMNEIVSIFFNATAMHKQ
jgi:hypothetical protein